MAKLGRRLEVDQRKSVQEPVLLPTTSRIGNNVGALKVDYMPYEIGQENAKAEMAVTNELTNMAFTVAEAVKVTQNINKQYKVNLLERDLQENDAIFASEMSETRTYEQKNDVVERYRASITAFGSQYNKIYPSATPKEQRVGLDMLSRSLTKASTYEVQANIAQFTETDADLQLRYKLNLDEFGRKAAIDPTKQLNIGIQLLEDRYKIGALNKDQFHAATDMFITEAYMARAKLMGRQFGDDISEGKFEYTDEKTGLPYRDLDEDQILFHIQARVGMLGNNIDESKVEQIVEEFNTARTAKMRAKNTEDTVNETTGKNLHKKALSIERTKYDILMEDGELTPESHKEHMQYLEASVQYSELARRETEYTQWKGANRIQSVFTEWTSQDGKIAQAIASGTASGSDYGMYNTATNSYNIDRIETLLKDQGITHKPTRDAIKAFYRRTHDVLSKGYNGGSNAKDEIKGMLTEMIGGENSGDVSGKPPTEFYLKWGIPIEDRGKFNYRAYSGSNKSLLDHAKQEYDIIRKFEAEMLGAIMRDINSAGQSQRYNKEKTESIKHHSQYTNADGEKVETPFYSEIIKHEKGGNSVIDWEQRTNTSEFSRQFRAYIQDIKTVVRQRLYSGPEWERFNAREKEYVKEQENVDKVNNNKNVMGKRND